MLIYNIYIFIYLYIYIFIYLYIYIFIYLYIYIFIYVYIYIFIYLYIYIFIYYIYLYIYILYLHIYVSILIGKRAKRRQCPTCKDDLSTFPCPLGVLKLNPKPESERHWKDKIWILFLPQPKFEGSKPNQDQIEMPDERIWGSNLQMQ